MSVTSTTVAGVPCFLFSGAVTDTEIKTAWAPLIVGGVYVLNRAIYLDNTCDLTNVQGGFAVSTGTQVAPGIILHTARDASKTIFKNFNFLMTTGLSVATSTLDAIATKVEASTVLAKEATLAQKLNTADYVAPDNTRITQIKTKIDTLENTDLTGIARTTDITALNDVSAQEVVAAMQAVAGDFKADVSALATQTSLNTINTKVDAIKAKTDVLVNTNLSGVATAAQVTALGSPMQADDYVAPDNTKIAEIKTKVDTLQNTDLTAVNSGIAEIKGTGFDATKHNLVAIKRQASLAAALSA